MTIIATKTMEIIFPITNDHDPIANPYINQRLTVVRSTTLAKRDSDLVSFVRIVFRA